VDASEERSLNPETGEIGSFRYGEASDLVVAVTDRECDR
jgi:hypothetical protein